MRLSSVGVTPNESGNRPGRITNLCGQWKAAWLALFYVLQYFRSSLVSTFRSSLISANKYALFKSLNPGEQIRKHSTNDDGMLKGHRDQLVAAPTGQIWEILCININSDHN